MIGEPGDQMIYSSDLKQERKELINKLRGVVERVEGEKRTMNTEERAEKDNISSAIDQLEERIRALEDVEGKEKDEDEIEESSASKRKFGNEDEEDDEDDDDERSRRALGKWAQGEKRGGRNINALLREQRSSPQYEKAFSKNLNYFFRHFTMHPQYRDVILGTLSDGGYFALPTQLSSQFVFALNNFSFMRKICNVEQLKNAASLGVRQYTNIPVASWNGENSQTTPDTNTTLARRDLSPNLIALIDTISLRELQASDDVEKYVLDRSYYAVAQLAETAAMTGSGSGQGLGIFTASSSGIATSRDYASSVALAKGFTGDDVINTYYTIPQQYTMSDKFGVFLSRGSMGYIRTLKTSQGQYLLEPGLATNRPDTLIGAKVMMSEYAPTFNPASPTASQYILCFGDFNYYKWCEVSDGGSQDAPSLQVLNERYADSHLRGYAFRYWCDMAPTLGVSFARLKLQAS